MEILNGWIQLNDRGHLSDLRIATLEELDTFCSEVKTDHPDARCPVDAAEYMSVLALCLVIEMNNIPDDVREFIEQDDCVDCLIGRFNNEDDLSPYWTTLAETYKKVKRISDCKDHDFEPIPTTTLDHCVRCGAIRDAG